MCFSRGYKEFTVTMAGIPIKCQGQVKHLGQFISYNLHELKEMEYKRSDLFRRFNHAMLNFKGISSDVKMRIFNSFCVHLYGSASWILDDSSLNKYITAWNICVRKLWNLDPKTHRILLPIIANTRPIQAVIGSRFMGLYRIMHNGSNITTAHIIQTACENQRSISCRNLAEIKQSTSVGASDIAIGMAIRELSLTVQGVYHMNCNFEFDDLQQTIVTLCIN